MAKKEILILSDYIKNVINPKSILLAEKTPNLEYIAFSEFEEKINEILTAPENYGRNTLLQLRVLYSLLDAFFTIKQNNSSDIHKELTKARNLQQLRQEMRSIRLQVIDEIELLTSNLPLFERQVQSQRLKKIWDTIEQLFSDFTHREDRVSHPLTESNLPLYSKANIQLGATFFLERIILAFHQIFSDYLQTETSVILNKTDEETVLKIKMLVEIFFESFNEKSLDFLQLFSIQAESNHEAWKLIANLLELLYEFEPLPSYQAIILQALEQNLES